MTVRSETESIPKFAAAQSKSDMTDHPRNFESRNRPRRGCFGDEVYFLKAKQNDSRSHFRNIVPRA
jgi:hypothetical protein